MGDWLDTHIFLNGDPNDGIIPVSSALPSDSSLPNLVRLGATIPAAATIPTLTTIRVSLIIQGSYQPSLVLSMELARLPW